MDVYYDYEAFINLILIRNHEIYFVLRNAKKKQTGYPKNYTEGSNTLKSWSDVITKHASTAATGMRPQRPQARVHSSSC